MRAGKMATAVGLIVLLGVSVAASGCYGGFNLTRSLYKWNGSLQADGDQKTNRVVQSAVMIVLWVVPVYELAVLADAVIINSMEFWTGKNPIQVNAPIIRTVDTGDERYVQTLARTPSGKEMRIDYYKQGQYVNTLIVRQGENSPTATGEVRWQAGRHEAFQVTYAGEETYIIGHTNEAGEQRYWIAPPAEVAEISSRAETMLAPPSTGAAAAAGLLLQ